MTATYTAEYQTHGDTEPLPTLVTSYRPITLLSTAFKVIERLILNLITPHIPLSPTQHGFQQHMLELSRENATVGTNGLNSMYFSFGSLASLDSRRSSLDSLGSIASEGRPYPTPGMGSNLSLPLRPHILLPTFHRAFKQVEFCCKLFFSSCNFFNFVIFSNLSSFNVSISYNWSCPLFTGPSNR